MFAANPAFGRDFGPDGKPKPMSRQTSGDMPDFSSTRVARVLNTLPRDGRGTTGDADADGSDDGRGAAFPAPSPDASPHREGIGRHRSKGGSVLVDKRKRKRGCCGCCGCFQSAASGSTKMARDGADYVAGSAPRRTRTRPLPPHFHHHV